MRKTLAFISAFAFASSAAKADDHTIPSITPNGLFGFMDDSTVIAKGVINPQLALAPSWSAGTQTWNQKATLNYGVTERFEAGIAITAAPTLTSRPQSTTRFLNLSLPLQYVLVQRMQNGFGFALVSTPALGWNDKAQAPGNRQWSFDNHLVLDHDFGGVYFAGINLGYVATNTITRGMSSPSGTLYAQAGATVKMNEHFYWGAQIQISQQFNQYFNDPAGWAAFLGTSVAMPINKTWTVSAAYMRQIVGGENERPSARLNTESFSQNIAKAVVSLYF